MDPGTEEQDSYQNPQRRRQHAQVIAPRDERLPWRTKLGYGMGHILNDLCASMWFTYLLLFFHKVLEFDNISAGIVLFVGQMADGMATPFVGYFSDKGDGYWLCTKYGKRKSWHLVGTVCVLASFPFIFLNSIDYASSHHSAQLVYYCAFVVIFQFGWASVQISHLSMIPDITPCTHERTGLTAIRYAMTVVSNISVYFVTWIFLGIDNDDGKITRNEAGAFRNIMLVSVSLGAFTSLLFHLLVKVEDNEENRLNGDNVPNYVAVRRMRTLDWFKEHQFYQVAGVYMTTRLFVNLSQAYIPLYLQITLELHASYVAIIPLVMFVFGLLTSMIMKVVNRKIGRKATFIIGCGIGITGCIWIKAAAINSTFTGYEIYGVAALVGSGGSTLLITSLSLTADLIGANSESGAFVYGAMSLCDKVSNGVAVILIQHFIPSAIDTCPDCRYYFRDVLFYVCGGAAFFGAIFMLSLVPFRLGERWRDKRGHRGEYESLPGGVAEHEDLNQSNNDEEYAHLVT